MSGKIILERGRKQYTLIDDVTPEQWHTFLGRAMDGLDEYGRSGHTVDDDGDLYVFGPRLNVLYTLRWESN